MGTVRRYERQGPAGQRLGTRTFVTIFLSC